MRTLLVDNYDSYTFNLFQLMAEVNGEEPIVVRNDTTTWAEIASWRLDGIVISPGPGRPDRVDDFGVCADILRHATLPVLGVCLGHQGIAAAAGAEVGRAPIPMHGRISRVWHDDTDLFSGVPQGFQVVRYHSLIVADALPPELVATAWTADGQIMGVRHRDLPRWGVQFHPESIATEHGRALMENFRDLAMARPASARPETAPDRPVSITPRPAVRQRTERPYVASARTLNRWYEPEHVFTTLCSGSSAAFWLDSSRVTEGLSRFSFLGAADGPLSQVVSYDVTERVVTVRTAGSVRRIRGTLFDFLRANLARGVDAPQLPFDFVGGYVGYLGYELKADSGGDAAHRSPHPDGGQVFADRFIAFDHQQRQVYLVALSEDDDTTSATDWFEQVSAALRTAAPLIPPDTTSPVFPVDVRPARPRAEYVADINSCLDYLAEGESYEVCLTSRVHAGPLPVPPLEVYRVLRRLNPAPYSAYLRFPGVDVLCSSPERFLRIDQDRWIEAKPIKGTAARSEDPAEDARLADWLRTDEKTRAENLMIVDLLRNDLGAVSDIGTVHVPALMAVESYQTVHQLVSTIRGRLRSGLTAVDCLQTVFPGGSMTGAPKRRSMQIIDRLENQPRGIYSGSIGYLSLNGTADLNIVIRTIVADALGTTIGTGGAIVALSDPDSEYDEIVLKATAPTLAIAMANRAVPAQDHESRSPARESAATVLAAAEGRR